MKPVFKTCMLSGIVLLLAYSFYAQGNKETANQKKEEKMTMTQNAAKNKAIIRRIYEESLNTGKLEMLNEVISADFTFQGNKGPSAYADVIRMLRQGFPDIKWTIQDLIAEGDRVVIRSSWTGTHTGTFRTFTATNKKVNDSAIAIYQFKDDKVITIWIETDRLGFLQQIGLIPEDVATLQKK